MIPYFEVYEVKVRTYAVQNPSGQVEQLDCRASSRFSAKAPKAPCKLSGALATKLMRSSASTYPDR